MIGTDCEDCKDFEDCWRFFTILEILKVLAMFTIVKENLCTLPAHVTLYKLFRPFVRFTNLVRHVCVRRGHVKVYTIHDVLSFERAPMRSAVCMSISRPFVKNGHAAGEGKSRSIA